MKDSIRRLRYTKRMGGIGCISSVRVNAQGILLSRKRHIQPPPPTDLLATAIKGAFIILPEAIPSEIHDRVANGDNLFCAMCGITVGEHDDFADRAAKFLVDSDVALCSTCYEGAKMLSMPSAKTRWLLAQVEQTHQFGNNE
jgi:hypothetical protein